MVRAWCGIQLKYKKRSADLTFMLSLNESIDQLVMANSVHWYDHVLRREVDHHVRGELDFVEGQRKMGRLMGT